MHVCKKCGSTDVYKSVWRGLNDKDAIIDDGMDEYYCGSCEDVCAVVNTDELEDPVPDSGEFLSDSWFDKADEAHKRSGGE